MIKSVFSFYSILLASSLIFFSCSKNENSYDSFQVFSGNLALKESADCGAECTNLKTEFRYLVYVAEKIYCYWDEKQTEYKMDLKQQASALENQITNKTSPTTYFSLLTKLAAIFKDGHVNAFIKDDLSDLEFYNVGLRLEMLAPGTDHESLIVSQISSGISNLKIGTVVNKIQGVDWKEYENEAEKLSSGSTLQMRRKRVGNNIFRVLLEKEGPRSVKIDGLYNGKEVSEIIARNLSLYDGMQKNDNEDGTGIELLSSSILDNNIGYLRIDGFSGSQMSLLLDQAMNRLEGTSGLIIDVRKNGGGDLSGNTLLSRFASIPINRFLQRVNTSDMLQALRPSILIDYVINDGKFSEIKARIVKPAEKNYSKPILVLTSGSCFSACDTFVSAIKENKLGIIIGEATGGGTGNPQGIELPYSEHKFRFSVAQGFTAVGRQLLEGVGTIPDILLEPTVEERVQQKDMQLQKALQYFSNYLKNPDDGNRVTNSSVALPDSLLLVKTKLVDKPYEIERDQELRKSGD